ncbi:SLC13 family permease [Kerstersia similis]|uniref:SLC13 family permease n=1 Tax=Kerstersia similis TaxID=206505 RepID=UPI0039F04174
MDITLLIFLIVYIAMGFGKLPGFKVDRTGAAVVGALAMMAAGSITPQAAWHSIDYRTICLLFGLMVVSAAFVESGFYAWTAQRVATLRISPPALLGALVVVAGVLSALLSNAVVVVAMTPLLVSLTLARGLNPVPFLLAFCFAANTGAAGTLIGSPKNMIIAQALDLSFVGLLRATFVPALISLPLVWGIVAFMYRRRWTLAATPLTQPVTSTGGTIPSLDRWETVKASLVTLAVIIAFVASDWPRELVALSAAGLLLINRQISSSDMLRHVDGNLLLLIMGLFMVNAAFSATGLPEVLLSDLRDAGIHLDSPIALFLVIALLCTLVGTNPSVMMLLPFLRPTAETANSMGAALVMGSSFSSNLFIFGSLAGIIVAEQAAACGVKISFGEFARAGLPVTLACMIMAGAWILLSGT